MLSIIALLAATPVAGPPLPAICLTEPDAAAMLVRVPFRIVDGRIYLDVQVNGKGPFTFAVDTGASGIGRADLSLVKALALPLAETGAASDGVSTATVPTTTLAELRLGDHVMRNVEVIARDYSGRMPPENAIAGILGRDFFAAGTLLIDYPNRILTYAPGAMLDPLAPGALAYERPYRVPVTIGGIAMVANLDTGANAELVMPQSAYAQVSDAPLPETANATLTNNDLTTRRGQLHGPIALGAARFADVDVRVSERFPEVMIGARLLQRHRIAIDQRSKTLVICP